MRRCCRTDTRVLIHPRPDMPEGQGNFRRHGENRLAAGLRATWRDGGPRGPFCLIRLCYRLRCNPSGWRDQMTAFLGRREFITLLGGAAASGRSRRARSKLARSTASDF